jgi:hypothetical protein
MVGTNDMTTTANTGRSILHTILSGAGCSDRYASVRLENVAMTLLVMICRRHQTGELLLLVEAVLICRCGESVVAGCCDYWCCWCCYLHGFSVSLQSASNKFTWSDMPVVQSLMMVWVRTAPYRIVNSHSH